MATDPLETEDDDDRSVPLEREVPLERGLSGLPLERISPEPLLEIFPPVEELLCSEPLSEEVPCKFYASLDERWFSPAIGITGSFESLEHDNNTISGITQASLFIIFPPHKMEISKLDLFFYYGSIYILF